MQSSAFPPPRRKRNSRMAQKCDHQLPLVSPPKNIFQNVRSPQCQLITSPRLSISKKTVARHERAIIDSQPEKNLPRSANMQSSASPDSPSKNKIPESRKRAIIGILTRLPTKKIFCPKFLHSDHQLSSVYLPKNSPTRRERAITDFSPVSYVKNFLHGAKVGSTDSPGTPLVKLPARCECAIIGFQPIFHGKNLQRSAKV